MRLSVIIPVYRSQDSLRPLVARLKPVLDEIAEEYELILVNDGSPDNSWAVVSELAAEHPWIRGIDLLRNYGQHNALLCGVRAASFPLIATLDDDLQHPPEEIPKLLAKLSEGFDVVYGTPQTEQHGLWRDLASRVTKLALQASMGVNVARSVSAFRIFRTDLREAFRNYTGSYVSIDVLLTWGTTRFAAVPVQHDARTIGASSYTFRKLLTHALNMVTGYSTVPLQFASLVGFVFTLFGIGILVFTVARFLVYGRVVPGFAFLASTIAIFSGVQLFSLGVIGEYIARMHFRLMERPTYTVRPAPGDVAASNEEDSSTQ
ncbi:MAG: glycosyltransferase family 2 protein [Candidatus Hydrogenedentota bacterium]